MSHDIQHMTFEFQNSFGFWVFIESAQSQCLNINIWICPVAEFFLGLSLTLRLWQDQTGSRPLAGSTRQQPIGRINQVADHGDGDEDEDKDEIPSYAMLVFALVERFGVSRMQDFFVSVLQSPPVCLSFFYTTTNMWVEF